MGMDMDMDMDMEIVSSCVYMNHDTDVIAQTLWMPIREMRSGW